MKVAITGASGFLGWHTRLRLHALTTHDVVPVTRADWPRLAEHLEGVDAVIHIAGVNRGNGSAVEQGNERLAQELVEASSSVRAFPRIVYANSIQDSNGTPYGNGKAGARQALSDACLEAGATFVDVRLPNLFGEHGRPQYNSFVATFVHSVKRGHTPAVQDREVGLLHSQDAAQELVDALHGPSRTETPSITTVGVRGVLDMLREFDSLYRRGDFPDLSTKFRVDLFNTYRVALFPEGTPISLDPHTDSRGSFVETVRSHGGEGQTSFSTTAPGITRGEHYHLQKVERFAVMRGQARISMRRMFCDEVFDFVVDGSRPVAIDMPTGWAHNITNIGDETLLTQFWTHEVFRPEKPDTFPERV